MPVLACTTGLACQLPRLCMFQPACSEASCCTPPCLGQPRHFNTSPSPVPPVQSGAAAGRPARPTAQRRARSTWQPPQVQPSCHRCLFAACASSEATAHDFMLQGCAVTRLPPDGSPRRDCLAALLPAATWTGSNLPPEPQPQPLPAGAGKSAAERASAGTDQDPASVPEGAPGLAGKTNWGQS